MKKLSIIIPVYNSSKTIKEVILEIEKTISENENIKGYEIILANDGSRDNSVDICKEISKKNSNVKFLNLSKNFGQHNAIMSALNHATSDYVVCMDDDLQTPASEINNLLKNIEENNYDVVYAKYKEKKHSNFRNFGSYINHVMATKLINQPENIKVTSFFIMKKFIVDEIVRYKNPYPYLSGLIFRVTQNIGELTVEHRERKEGKSNYTLTKLFGLWANGFTNFSVKPLRIASMLGGIFSILSFIYVIILFIRKLLDPSLQLGWTSIMISIIFLGAIQLLSIGLLGEYIGRIYLCINNNPQFVVKESYNMDNQEVENENK